MIDQKNLANGNSEFIWISQMDIQWLSIYAPDRFTDHTSSQIAQKYKRANQMAGIAPKRAKLVHA